ncbi:MAG: glycerol-3-phosphate acyltransferase [Chloroflexota bacterium]|nr:glycerol-3-phosphate acyltransferase [Chloroflexota bacterium]
MKWVLALLVIVVGYLLGSIPFSYLLARAVKGIDLRQYGSGNVGGSNVGVWLGTWATVVAGLGDLLKAALPTWLALHVGFGLPVALTTGLAAVVGHSWSLYLRFSGGRGLSAWLGTLAVTFFPGAVYFLGWLAAGHLARMTAVGALVGLVTLPVFAWLLGRPPAMIVACVMALIIILFKRLEANRLPLPVEAAARRRVLFRRLVLDRDVGPREEWVQRTPGRRTTDWQNDQTSEVFGSLRK